jgi:hypothetical protein
MLALITTWIYRAIVLLVLVFVVWFLFDSKKWQDKFGAALVMIPLILRMLLIK